MSKTSREFFSYPPVGLLFSMPSANLTWGFVKMRGLKEIPRYFWSIQGHKYKMGVSVGKSAFPLWSRFHAQIKSYDRDRTKTLACSLKGYYLWSACKLCIEKGDILQSRTQETMTCMPSAETRLLSRRSEHLLLDSLLFVLCRSVYCLCVNVYCGYCHRVATQLQ
jgi:hypothetical protein